MAFKVCSIDSEPPDIDLCPACHVYRLFRGAQIISILFILNKLTLGMISKSYPQVKPLTFRIKTFQLLKSVQSTLSHLQSPPEEMQSQRNYGSFLSKSHLHGMILLTMFAQNRPTSKRQCFNRAIRYFKIVNIKQVEATAICLRTRGKC